MGLLLFSSSNSTCPVSTTTSTTGPTFLQFELTAQVREAARGACQGQGQGGDVAILDTPEEIQNMFDNLSDVEQGGVNSSPDGSGTANERGGIYVLTLVDWYAYFPSITVFGMLDCFVVTWIYGTHRLERITTMMWKKAAPRVLTFSLKYICPGLLLVIFGYSLYMYSYRPPKYETTSTPPGPREMDG